MSQARCTVENSIGRQCVRVRHVPTLACAFVGDDGWEWGNVPVRLRESTVAEMQGEIRRLRSGVYDVLSEGVRLLKNETTLWEPLLAAAKALRVAADSAAETYTVHDAPEPDLAGTFIVATTEYERLDVLMDAAVVCQEAIAACEEKP